MIPKIFHHIWLNPPMPDHLAAFVASWRIHHPDWEFRLWTDWPRDGQGMSAPTDLFPYFDRPVALAVKSNLLRLELMWQFGGVYLDCDVECHRPIDALLEGCDAFFCAEFDERRRGRQGPSGINNGVFGAAPGHPAIGELVRGTADIASQVHVDDADAALTTGPAVFQFVVHRRSDGRILEQDLFHDLLPQEVKNGVRTVSPRAYGTHWFELSWHPLHPNNRE